MNMKIIICSYLFISLFSPPASQPSFIAAEVLLQCLESESQRRSDALYKQKQVKQGCRMILKPEEKMRREF